MADEPKGIPPNPASEGSPQLPAAGSGSGAPPKPAASPAKPTPPPGPEPWVSPLLGKLQVRFPGSIVEATIFRGLPTLLLATESLLAICQFLKSEAGGAYTLLTDETAVDFPQREKRFDVVYHLYSFQRNDRLRLKVQVADGELVPSVVSIWSTANWLEREIYDMFGIRFASHPDLKRILLPDDWVGHPLRKDYDILRQDDAWVQANLGIKSGQ